MNKKLVYIQCSLDAKCSMCTGEVCELCGAGSWNYNPDPPCTHDIIDRHTMHIECLSVSDKTEKDKP